MTKHLFRISVTVLFVGCLSVVTASAQARTQELVASVPFAFSANHVMLPAGKYSVEIASHTSNLTIIKIKSISGKASVLLQLTDTTNPLARLPRLVFQRYGQQIFLCEAWMGDGNSLRTIMSRAERQAWTKNANKTQIQTVSMAKK
ncbi:MAG: hypothetical protein ABR555_02630 [Pyrinomonadaceae bacterium]